MPNSISESPSVLYGPEPNPGDRVGSYILDRKLGSGGMRHVWKATHEATREPYSVKLFPQMIAAHPDAWDQVLANFQLVRKLNHQNICPMLFLERDPQWGPYLLMNFIDGISLAKYRQRKETFTVEEVAALLKPVAEALDYAHAQKIIHRDVKHDNILLKLAEDGETIIGTFVIDFGLAAQVRSTINRFSQQSVTAAGTRPYMAPEIWRSRPPVAASDQYALAVVAYELLAGYFPFDNDDLAVLREAVLKESIEGISGLETQANEALLKGLAKEAGCRFLQGCGAFITALDKVSIECVQPEITDLTFVSSVMADEHDLTGLLQLGRRAISFIAARGPIRITDWQRLANSGNPSAMWLIGHRYLSGLGDVPAPEEAVKWFRRAAEKGHSPAMFDLGRAYASGVGENMDRSLATEWFHRAAEIGNTCAMVELGLASCSDGLFGGKQATSRSVEWFKKAAEAGSPAGMFQYAIALQNGNGIVKDALQGMSWLHKCAELGSLPAWRVLADWYECGNGIAEDQISALNWRLKLITECDDDATFSSAMIKVAETFKKGEFIEKSPHSAFHWYRKAAELGDKNAFYSLALMYAFGDGVSQDLPSAAIWFRRLVDLSDDTYVYTNIAAVYETGVPIRGSDGLPHASYPEGPRIAIQWLTEGADRGIVDCMSYLGEMFWTGEFIPRDHLTATMWFRKAAVQGCYWSMCRLGKAYEQGLGVSADRFVAKQWYEQCVQKVESDHPHRADQISWCSEAKAALSRL